VTYHRDNFQCDQMALAFVGTMRVMRDFVAVWETAFAISRRPDPSTHPPRDMEMFDYAQWFWCLRGLGVQEDGDDVSWVEKGISKDRNYLQYGALPQRLISFVNTVSGSTFLSLLSQMSSLLGFPGPYFLHSFSRYLARTRSSFALPD
jgi:hypothetical protein